MSTGSMKLRTRLAMGVGAVALFFAVALMVALSGMQNVKGRFETFIEQDQELLQALTEMYAQGLQMGQALRNIAIDPANKTGHQNLEAARTAFKDANASALRLAATSPETLKVLREIAELRETQTPIQAKIVAAALTNQANAFALLNAEETPTWRQMRSRLQDLMKARREEVAVGKAAMVQFTQRVLMVSLALGLAALVAGSAIAIWLTRSVLRRLGGEPDVVAAITHRIAGGDLTADVATREGDNASLLASVKTMQDGLRRTVGQIKTSVEAITTGTTEIAAGNQDLSQRTEEQASSLEETASSMEELTSTVKQNADNARQANQLAASASEIAVKGGAVVGDVVSTMGAISESSKKIADIIGVIDGIAFQTNILALNAAVEAARAGEQGRGFAVVAGEVRNLAQRSAAAAKEIKALIEDSVGKVDSGTKLVDQAGHTMEEVVSSIKRVTDIMAEITAASQEQSSGIEQVNQAVTQMDQVTQQNAALVEEAAAAAESMQQQAHQLAGAVAVFKLDAHVTVQAVKAVAPDKALFVATRKAAPAPTKSVKSAGRTAPQPRLAKTGTNDEWTEF